MGENKRELKIVQVKDIPEFSSWLGNRCTLLSHYGLFPYRNTEEEICEFLEQSAKDPKMLNICLKSRCGEFYRYFQRGDTPFMESDPIYLEEYGGKYWVSEGKHRVCLAKRMGVKTISAFVYHLSDDFYSLLPQIGEPGRYQALFSYDPSDGRAKAEGTVLLLMVYDIDKICHHLQSRLVFDEYRDTSGSMKTILEGIRYRVKVVKETSRRLFSRSQTKVTVTSEVAIESDHKKTKIWLLEIPANLLDSVALHDERLYDAQLYGGAKSIYRYGRWRKINLKAILHKNYYAPPPSFLLGKPS